MNRFVTLSDFARSYVAGRAISPIYAGTLIRRAIALEKFAHERAVGRLLNEQNVNAFLTDLAPGVSTYTLKSYRGDLLTLWRAAADDGLCGYPVLRKIRRDRLEALVVECYTEVEARALAECASEIRGGLPNGVPKRLYWSGVIRAGWDTGLRRGDLWRLKRNAIRPDGSLLIAQHKTGGIAECRLRPSTLAVLDKIGTPQPLAWPHNSWTFGEHFRLIVKAANVHRGTFRWLRRASGSYVESQQMGAGHRHLGHSTPAIFNKHYDARVGAVPLPLPPEL